MAKASLLQADLTRAIKAVKKTGEIVHAAEICPDGRILLRLVESKTETRSEVEEYFNDG